MQKIWVSWLWLVYSNVLQKLLDPYHHHSRFTYAAMILTPNAVGILISEVIEDNISQYLDTHLTSC